MKIKKGDRVRILEVPPAVKKMADNELHTRQAFEENVGKVYIVKEIDKHGHLELELPNLDSIWIEPEFVELTPVKKSKAT